MNQIDRLSQKIERLAKREVPKLKDGFAILNGMLQYTPAGLVGAAPASDKLKKAEQSTTTKPAAQRWAVVRNGGKDEEDRILALLQSGDTFGRTGERTYTVVSIHKWTRAVKLLDIGMDYSIRNVVGWADWIERPVS